MKSRKILFSYFERTKTKLHNNNACSFIDRSNFDFLSNILSFFPLTFLLFAIHAFMTFLSFWTIFICAFFKKTKKKIHENWKSLTFCERHQYLGGHTFSPFQNGSSANFSVCRIEYRERFPIYKGMLFVIILRIF